MAAVVLARPATGVTSAMSMVYTMYAWERHFGAGHRRALLGFFVIVAAVVLVLDAALGGLGTRECAATFLAVYPATLAHMAKRANLEGMPRVAYAMIFVGACMGGPLQVAVWPIIARELVMRIFRRRG